MLLDATGCYWMLLDATGCYRMLLDATGCYWMLLDATGCYWMLLDATGCYWMLLDATGCYRMLLDATGCYWMLLDATGCYWMLLDARRPKSQSQNKHPVCARLRRTAITQGACPSASFCSHSLASHSGKQSTKRLQQQAKLGSVMLKQEEEEPGGGMLVDLADCFSCCISRSSSRFFYNLNLH